jgi:hypothetical protein
MKKQIKYLKMKILKTKREKLSIFLDFKNKTSYMFEASLYDIELDS